VGSKDVGTTENRNSGGLNIRKILTSAILGYTKKRKPCRLSLGGKSTPEKRKKALSFCESREESFPKGEGKSRWLWGMPSRRKAGRSSFGQKEGGWADIELQEKPR